MCSGDGRVGRRDRSASHRHERTQVSHRFHIGSYIKDVRMKKVEGVGPMWTDADTGGGGSEAMRTSTKTTVTC